MMTKTMTDEEFWKVVAAAKWEELTRPELIGNNVGDNSIVACRRPSYEMAKENLIRVLPDLESSVAYSVALSRKFDELYERFDVWERDCSDQERYDVRSTTLGDDGHSDLLYHIIGLGRDVFEDAMKHPEHVTRRARGYDFVESFSYARPDDEDYYSPRQKLAIVRRRQKYWNGVYVRGPFKLNRKQTELKLLEAEAEKLLALDTNMVEMAEEEFLDWQESLCSGAKEAILRDEAVSNEFDRREALIADAKAKIIDSGILSDEEIEALKL